MHVLQISEDYYPVKAGGAFVDTEVAEAASGRGFDVTVVTLRYSDAPRKETRNGVQIYRPVNPLWSTRPYGSLLNVIGRLVAVLLTGFYIAWYVSNSDIDLIYSTNHFVHPVSKVFAVVMGVPLVSFVGYTPSLAEKNRRYWNPLYLFEQINFRYFLGEHIHCRNPGVRDLIAALNPGSTVGVAHGILNDEPFLEARNGLDENGSVKELRNELVGGPDSVLLLYVGSLEAIKRPEAAVRVTAELPERYELVVIGKGEKQADAERAARREGVSERVTFLGELTHVRTLQTMLVADALLLTSRSESYSAVVLEALACSCHVFASPVGVVPEIEDEIDCLEMSTVDSMPDRVRHRDGIRSPVAIDEEILEMFPIERYTAEICESFVTACDTDQTV